LEEFGNGKGKLAKASEEGQGPRRAVEPMMMMNILYVPCIIFVGVRDIIQGYS
jgi:hypothetical protein